jgi:hypothetical protein
MRESDRNPPLIALHPKSSLNRVKLEKLEQLSTDLLIASLAPGQRDSLKTRRDGTIIDGHHRIHVLLARGVHVDELPREIIEKKEL